MRALVAGLAVLGMLACGDRSSSADDKAGASEDTKGGGNMTATGFAPELEIDTAALTTTGSGLRYLDLKVGEGPTAKAGQEATVHYTGWLTNGTKFDSSRDRDQPFTFGLGSRQVIAGWDEGVAGMNVGGRRKLVLPANLGYGEAGAPPTIPPGATLVFDVELLGVE